MELMQIEKALDEAYEQISQERMVSGALGVVADYRNLVKEIILRFENGE